MGANHMTFPGCRKFETTVCGKPFVVETGKFAGLANGSCLVKLGETVVLATVTASNKPRPGIDFFPLSVDVEERLYAVGRIPGSFPRREGRPSESAILASRCIDRPMRPLFPKDMRNDVAIVCTIMGCDGDNSPEIASMLGASIAVAISDVPFDYTIAGLSVGLVDGKIILNPDADQRKKTDLDLTVAATYDKIVMIEAGANEVEEDIMLKALKTAHEEIQKTVLFIDDIKSQIGKPKFSYKKHEPDVEFFQKVHDFCYEDMLYVLDTDDKTVRDSREQELRSKFEETLEPDVLEQISAEISECFDELKKKIVRKWLTQGKRVDGRGMLDIRPLDAKVSVLPRAHGSGLFTRGQTQVLTVATLGTLRDVQELDTVFDSDSKRYIHHYNFPSYSVGETRPSRGPGRREIGHGALAERALAPVIPSEEDFPYTIRLVSEVLSSNGSTSQGSVCASTLALMDAGVPITAPIAGISCGLITDGDRPVTFVDIQGVEDFYGDMDFKVAGSKKGITAIQVDIKVDGLSYETIEQAFEKCRTARYMILDEVMLKAIGSVRKDLSPWAPKMIRFEINPDKIREVIGKGGSVIQKITADTNTKIDITDDGKICIAAVNTEDAELAKKIVMSIVKEPEVGEIYHAKVVRIMNFGAFVELMPGKDGMVHISKLSHKRVEKIEEFVKADDMLWVKVMEIDDKGRINLSCKDVKEEEKCPQ